MMDVDLLKSTCLVKPENLFINKKDNSILVKISGGEFEMGDGLDVDCPKHRIFLDDFYIGIYTITNQQYKMFVDETGHRLPDIADRGYPLWRDGSFPQQYANHPVICVSWEDAIAYCNWAGLTLPTEAQWEKATRGLQSHIYPWGNEWNSKNCLNYMNKGAEHTCRVNDFPQGSTSYGLFNTAGNVLEWCYDYYKEDYYNSSPYKNPTGPKNGVYRIARGGSWGSNMHDCRSANRSDFDLASIRTNFRGFRTGKN